MSSVSSDSSDDSDATITEEVVLGRSKPRAAGSIHRIGKPELPLTRVKHSIELQMVAPLGVYTRVSLTHVVDANNMYVRWDGSAIATNFETTTEELRKLKLQALEGYRVGDYCLVGYSGDERNEHGVYRACIVELDVPDQPAFVKVSLVDNGVETTVPKDEIYYIPDRYMNQRRMCFKFGLLRYAQVQSGIAFEISQDYFQQLFSNNRICVLIKATAFNENGEVSRQLGELGFYKDGLFGVAPAIEVYKALLRYGCVVDYVLRDFLLADRESIVSTLVRPTANERDRLPLVRSEKVWVDPDLESLNDFYVIRYAQIGRKTDMDEMITTMDSVGLDSYLPWEEKVGEWCLKLHERDPKWLRAKVLVICGDEAKIEFLDCGGILVTKLTNLKNMPEFARKIPGLKIHCSLPVRPVEEKYSPMIIKNFKNLNELEVDVMAHVIRHMEGYQVEADLEIRNMHDEKFSFSKRLVENKVAVWSNVEYAVKQIRRLIPNDSDTSESSETASTASAFDFSEMSEIASACASVCEFGEDASTSSASVSGTASDCESEDF